MKIRIWQISGYLGWSDYDNSDDDNFKIKVAMDSRFTRKDVEEIFANRFSKRYRSVVIRAVVLEEKEI